MMTSGVLEQIDSLETEWILLAIITISGIQKCCNK